MEIEERCNAIEECYEFMLAYAAQGLPSDKGNRSGGQIREFLSRAVNALNGLADSYITVVRKDGLEPVEKYQAFFEVLNRDALDSLAAIELVLVQPTISSQLVDNLNASIHLRALLTDLFLIDELLKTQRQGADLVAITVGR
jgi:DNA polymerase III delta prime subunit